MKKFSGLSNKNNLPATLLDRVKQHKRMHSMGERVGILGGSFNPVHCGHVRLAIEACQSMSLARVDLVPCSHPPHKPADSMLPFALRKHLLELAIGGNDELHALDNVRVNDLEARREGPSYTYDTLRHYREHEPEADIHFILGAGDLLTLPTWHKGLELPELTSFIVVTREQVGPEQVQDFVRTHWSEQTTLVTHEPHVRWHYQTKRSVHTTITHVNAPCLDISGTMIRQAMQQNQSIRYLVPEKVEMELARRGLLQT